MIAEKRINIPFVCIYVEEAFSEESGHYEKNRIGPLLQNDLNGFYLFVIIKWFEEKRKVLFLVQASSSILIISRALSNRYRYHSSPQNMFVNNPLSYHYVYQQFVDWPLQ